MKLILLRHGKTEANEKRLYCGSTDLPLSDNGKAELSALKNSAAYPDISGFRVIASGMKRCEETISVLFGECWYEVMPELAEMSFGAFEMRSYEQLKNDAAYIAWISGDNEANIAPGGESGGMMKTRVLAALGGIIKEGRDALIVTHGGPVAAIMGSLFTNENKNRYEWQPGPGLGYVIEINGHTAEYSAIGR